MQRLRRHRWLAVAAAVTCIAVLTSAASAVAQRGTGTHAAAGATRSRAPRHIFYIMMENHGYREIIGNWRDAPFINRLARRANTERDYFGVTHPSLPNYLAAVSGSFQGIWDDCKAGSDVTCTPEEFVPGSGDATDGNYLTQAEVQSASATPHLFNSANLVDQLQQHHLSWRAYMQSMPSVGSQVEYAPTIHGTTVKLYAQKHNPFMYFSDINYAGSPRLRHIVPLGNRLARDLRSGNVPNFVWISPDQCHDMHGVDPASAQLIGIPTCGYPDSGLDHGAIRLGDAFLRRTVRMITGSPVWRTSRSSIVITWDEDDYSGIAGTSTSPAGRNGVILGGAHVPMLVLNSQGGARRVMSVPANHYNLLATIQQEWHLGCIAATCSMPRQQLLTPLFN